MSAELLPCPFCGGPVQLEKTHKSRDEIYGVRQWWGVRCTNNVNVGGTCAIEAIPTASPGTAIERWNRRAPVIAPLVAATQGEALLEAIRNGVPLEEPVSVCKAMMARRPARSSSMPTIYPRSAPLSQILLMPNPRRKANQMKNENQPSTPQTDAT